MGCESKQFEWHTGDVAEGLTCTLTLVKRNGGGWWVVSKKGTWLGLLSDKAYRLLHSNESMLPSEVDSLIGEWGMLWQRRVMSRMHGTRNCDYDRTDPWRVKMGAIARGAATRKLGQQYERYNGVRAGRRKSVDWKARCQSLVNTLNDRCKRSKRDEWSVWSNTVSRNQRRRATCR